MLKVTYSFIGVELAELPEGKEVWENSADRLAASKDKEYVEEFEFEPDLTAISKVVAITDDVLWIVAASKVAEKFVLAEPIQLNADKQIKVVDAWDRIKTVTIKVEQV